MDSNEIIGKIIRERRVEKGIGLRQMAKDLNTAPSFISDIERGIKRCSDELLSNIAKYLDLDEGELFKLGDRLPKGLLEEYRNNDKVKEILSQIAGRLEDEDIDHILEVIYKIKENRRTGHM